MRSPEYASIRTRARSPSPKVSSKLAGAKSLDTSRLKDLLKQELGKGLKKDAP